MRYGIGAILALLLLTGCETAIDPATGQARTRLTLPLTEANAERAQRQWQECIQFRSESYCERTLPGGRPPNTPSPGQPGLGRGLAADYPDRDSDP